MPATHQLISLNVLNKEVVHEIDSLHRFRNNLIHGIEIADVDYIHEATERIQNLLESFKQSSNSLIQEAIKQADWE